MPFFSVNVQSCIPIRCVGPAATARESRARHIVPAAGDPRCRPAPSASYESAHRHRCHPRLMPRGHTMASPVGSVQPGRGGADSPSRGFTVRSAPSPSPLSTPLPHNIWCHAADMKRIVDGSGRVDFYEPCARVEGAAGKFSARSFSRFPAFRARFRPFTRLAGVWGFLGFRTTDRDKWRGGRNLLLTLYLVFTATLRTR